MCRKTQWRIIEYYCRCTYMTSNVTKKSETSYSDHSFRIPAIDLIDNLAFKQAQYNMLTGQLQNKEPRKQIRITLVFVFFHVSFEISDI